MTVRFSALPEGIGKELRRERMRQEKSISEIAEKAGIDAAYLSRIERSEYGTSIGMVNKVAAALYMKLVLQRLEEIDDGK